MVRYGFDRVRDSLRQMTADNPMHKPVIGRLALASMRVAFRTASRVPAVKRRMAESLSRDRAGAD